MIKPDYSRMLKKEHEALLNSMSLVSVEFNLESNTVDIKYRKGDVSVTVKLHVESVIVVPEVKYSEL